MDQQLKDYYAAELRHLRAMGAEFAREFPNVAKRLSLDEFDCADPYVERLLEGFAFLTARVQQKLDASFPRFTQALLETVYPHYLAPTPSTLVVQLEPDPTQGRLANGFTVPRGTRLRTRVTSPTGTPCEYRTAHDVTLWPLQVLAVRYHSRDLAMLGLPADARPRAAVSVRVRTTGGVPLPAVAVDQLTFYLHGNGDLAGRLYEQLFAAAGDLYVRPYRASGNTPYDRLTVDRWRRPVGFDDDQALLPYDDRSFQGYRLLKEYFTLPERFRFVAVAGIRPTLVRSAPGDELQLVVLLDRADPHLEDALGPQNLALHATPAVNLIPREADRIPLTARAFEHQVVVDRTRPLDYEVYQVRSVTAYGASAHDRREFSPFYAARDDGSSGGGGGGTGAYYAVHRVRRTAGPRGGPRAARSPYLGSEVYLSLVDVANAPLRTDLRQMGVNVLCTNRDLPLYLPFGGPAGNGGGTGGDAANADDRLPAAPATRPAGDFTWDLGGPLADVRCLVGPTRPRPSWAEVDASWRLISHLSLNYLSLTDTDARSGAAALRDLLRLYADVAEPHVRQQVDGVLSVSTTPIVSRVPTPGPITFARGLQIALTVDESAFDGTSPVLLGAVLERFFARYVTINCFTQTVLLSGGRGEVMRWPLNLGGRPPL